MAVPPASTYVAIDRTPIDSAARGTIFMRRQQYRAAPRLCRGAAERRGAWGALRGPPCNQSNTPAAIDFDAGAGDHGGVVAGEEDGGAREVLGLVEAAQRHGSLVALAALGVHDLLAHERGQHRRLRGHGG